MPTSTKHVITADSGLKLRTGPGQGFPSKKAFAKGTEVLVVGRSGDWAKVDVEGNGVADGFMLAEHLRPVAGPAPTAPPTPAPAAPPTPTPAPAPAPAAASGFLASVTPEKAKKMFPATPLSAIKANLPHVLAGLAGDGLTDKPMVLMALGTIRAETEGFVPIDEGRSKFNTATTPFDKYEPGTGPGVRLGNTKPGDGARFKGRGYVQLTGRDNYTRIGAELRVDLVGNPALANDPALAGRILARFIKNKEAKVRAALAKGDLKEARKLVNGGSHGLDRFTDAFERGRTAL